ncbi:MAG TPA: DeoR/GlpR family DNA-binding transcription regulator [Chloroflexota bacterium]
MDVGTDRMAATEPDESDRNERPLLAIERRMVLANLVRRNPVVTVDDLARRFNVSAQTIRRDFQALEQQGLLTRTYGGAVTNVDDTLHLSREHAFRAREGERATQKQAIARTAIPLVEPESTIIFDASTTVLQLARALPMNIEITAIVNALPIAGELSRRPNVALTMIGGTLRHTSVSFTGPISEASLGRLFADAAFISARGLALQRGLTEANPSESALKEMMVNNATRVVALIDSSKLGRTALSLFAPFSALDILVTDDGADAAIVEQVRAAGVEVHIASTE